MSSVENIKIFSLLKKTRKNKTLLFLFFLAALLCSYVIYYYQLDWLDFNCNHGRNSKSCIYKTQRLYLIPALGFIGCFVVLFLDKIAHSIVVVNNKFESLSTRVSGIILIIYSIALSIFLFGYRFSFYILDPTRIDWIRNIDSDLILVFSSWNIFRESPWGFPLGFIHSLNYPDGISIAYSDPIIFLCFIFKIFNDYLPNDFQYLGIWYFLSYVLQGLFAALIFKNVKCELKIKFIVIPFLVFSTVLLNRVAHVNLNAHWLILASFYIYLSPNMSITKKTIWHSVLVFFTAWLHPYQTFILFALQTALFIKTYLEDKKHLKYLSLLFTLTLFFVILSWYVIGYFHLGGNYSGSRLFISNLNTFINSLGYSTLLMPLSLSDGVGGAEGSAYLGLGLLMILVVLLFENWPKDKYIMNKENKPLLWIVCILAIIATGFNFRFGNISLLILPRPMLIDHIFLIFRSVGRFIWPAYYFIVIFILLSLIYRERSIVKTYILFIAALMIQLIDIYSSYKPIPLDLAKGFKISRDFSPWEKFMGKDKNKLIFYPNRNYSYEDFWILSKKNNYSINIGYFARNNSNRDSENEKKTYNNIMNGLIPKDTVYVVLKDEMNIILSSQNKNNFICEDIQEFYACKDKSNSFID